MKIVPVNFNKERSYVKTCNMIPEDDGGKIAITLDRFDKLITSLRTAVDSDCVLD
ncbi:MAG TPA: hypothetical protein VFR94_12240 [Nitrososphaeraceae archaeon]|nr:hypothetical protein [Nitrososphaeraceae archaeon]